MKNIFLFISLLLCVAGNSQNVLKQDTAQGQIFVEYCIGGKTIFEASNVFTAGMDIEFKDKKLNVRGDTTGKEEVKIFTLAKNANFAQIFTSLNSAVDSLCFTQGQIINFCEVHRDKTSEKGWTFFLFKSNGNFFVAEVNRVSVKKTKPGEKAEFILNTQIFPFETPYLWKDVQNYLFVIPKHGLKQ